MFEGPVSRDADHLYCYKVTYQHQHRILKEMHKRDVKVGSCFMQHDSIAEAPIGALCSITVLY